MDEANEMNRTSARANGGAVRHPWYDDRLGRAVRTGLGDVRNARPSDDVWLRIAGDLGIPADAGLAVGLAAAPNGWLRRVDRWRVELISPFRHLASISAIAVAVLIVGLSFDVVLSGQSDQSGQSGQYGGPFTWTTAGLHQIGVPQDEAGIQPSPQNRAPADMSAARWWPGDRSDDWADDTVARRRDHGRSGGSPLVLAPAYAGRPPARVVVPR